MLLVGWWKMKFHFKLNIERFSNFINKHTKVLELLIQVGGVLTALIVIVLTYQQLSQNTEALNLSIKSLEAQQNQYIIDNRPFVYIEGLSINNTQDVLNLRMNLLNVGKLPAIVDSAPNMTIILWGVNYPLRVKQNTIILYPTESGVGTNSGLNGQGLSTLIEKAGSFDVIIKFNYFALNDINRTHAFYYYANYTAAGGTVVINDQNAG